MQNRRQLCACRLRVHLALPSEIVQDPGEGNETHSLLGRCRRNPDRRTERIYTRARPVCAGRCASAGTISDRIKSTQCHRVTEQTAVTVGLLRRASIVVSEIVPVGKETDRRWDEGEDMSLLDFEVLEYRAGRKRIADAWLKSEILRLGMRGTMRATKLSQHTIERALRDEVLSPRTLKTLTAVFRIVPGGGR
jgi:hypothetical protein